jgi:ABC-type uncharacterized transport system permease subunit
LVFGGPRVPELGRMRRIWLRAALVLHTALFVVRWQIVGHFPVSETWSTISAVALATGALYAWIVRYVGHPGTGGIVLGVVFLMQLAASGLGPLEPHTRVDGVNAIQITHISTSVVAAAALVLSGLHGFLYLVLFRAMRKRRFGQLVEQLPDLSLLARMTRRAALAGFVLAGVGLNFGIWMAHRNGVPGFGYTDPHVLAMLILWLHFGAIAFSGRIRGFSARYASFAATAGLVVLLFTLLLPLFPGVTFHSTP